MGARTRTLLVAGAVALACAAFAPAAGAATAYVTDDGAEQVLRYEAEPGERQWLTLKIGEDGYELRQHWLGSKPPIAPGAGCTALHELWVTCAAPGLDRIEVSLGDESDTFRIDSSDLAVVADGGGGNDSLEDASAGAGAPRSFAGGPGGDSLRGPASSSSAHDYSGGPDHDFVDYHVRTEALQVSLDDLANDGVAGEGDNVHSDVEYLQGGAGDDTIVGTDADEEMVGNDGADRLEGMGGKDELYGSFGCDADVLLGGPGPDTLQPGGDNEVHGGPGDDRILSDYRPCPDGAYDDIFGGEGTDTADFSQVYWQMSVSLDDVADDGWEGVDNFHSDIENAKANYFGMELIGNDGPNVLTGAAGDDLLNGRGGADQLVGGDGIDLVDYSERSEPLDLSINGLADDGAPGEHDAIGFDIENLRAGSGDDKLTGDSDDNVLDGGLGADVISGGYGLDAVDYFDRVAAVAVDVDGVVGDDGEPGEHDTVGPDVEGIFGGMGDDTLVGNGTSGFLAGFEGDDQLRDPGGVDYLDAGEGADTLDITDGMGDTADCGAGPDTLKGDTIDDVGDDCEAVSLASPPPPTPPTTRVPRTPRTLPTPLPRTPHAPVDRVAPTGSMLLPKGQRVRSLFARGLKVRVRSDESGTIAGVLVAESSTRRVLKRLRLPAGMALARGRLNTPPGATRILTVRLRPQGRKALRGLAVAKLKLAVTFTDRAGNARTLTRHLRLPR